MASITLQAGGRWPEGTTVSAYPKANWLVHELPPVGAPKGAVAASGTVLADRTVRLAGLRAGVGYFGYALVGGEHRYSSFVAPAAATADVEGVAVGVRQVAADIVRLFKALGGERYWGQDLRQTTGLPGAGGISGYTAPFILSRSAIYEPFLNAGTQGTRTGTFTNASQALASGGQYWYSTTAGDKVDSTALPSGALRAGVRIPVVSNGGIWRVKIGGDATRANRCLTAQQMVTAGKLASSVLVANGGILNPTDRVLDCYSAATDAVNTADYDRHFILADGSAGGAALGGAVVTLECTGYQNAQGTSSNRCYVSADWLTYATATTTRGSVGANLLPTTRTLSHLDSAYEYAKEVIISATALFVGNVHGYESQTAFTIQIDGRTITPAVGDMIWANRIDLARDTNLYHSQVGAGNTPIGGMRTFYTMSSLGLDIGTRPLWAQAVPVLRDYVGMFPTDGDVFTSGRVNGVDYALTANDGTYKGQVAVPTASVIGTDGGLTITCTLTCMDPVLSTDNWADSAPMHMAVEDRIPTNVNVGNLSKIYSTRKHTGTGAVTYPSGAAQFAAHRYELEVE